MEVLTFKLADEPFGISIDRVEAIEHLVPVTYVPKAKAYIAGLINIRGDIVPAIDMGTLLNLGKAYENNKLILIRSDDQPIALMVDDVDDVINIEESDIETVSGETGDFSIINYNERVITFISEKQINII